MKYLVIGAGGTGGPLVANLTQSGFDVTLIARNKTLEQIKQNGLTIEKSDGSTQNLKIKVSDEKSYNETPDVIFLCVKSYSVDSTLEFLNRVMGENTILIPLLNIYTTGEYLQEKFPNNIITDGCIYIASSIKQAGIIEMQGEIFRIFFGTREENLADEKLNQIENDLIKSGIDAHHSKKIKADALEKFSFVSVMASCGLYYDCYANEVQTNAEVRATFIKLTQEVLMLAEKMGVTFEIDIVKKNLQIMDNLAPNAMASMQRDIKAGNKSEIDGLIHDVVKKSHEFGLCLEMYEKISTKFKNM